MLESIAREIELKIHRMRKRVESNFHDVDRMRAWKGKVPEVTGQ